MATPHPGKWELLLTPASCQLSTVDPAVHAAVVANRNTGAWKVLFFQGASPFLWDPLNSAQVSGPQTVPAWPGSPFGPRDFFCAGHSHMEDGRLLVGGGNRATVECENGIHPRGLPYTYLYDPITEQWTLAGPAPNHHPMADGRWYPTLTTLGEGPGYGRVLAMSGLRKDVVHDNGDCHSVVNKDPEVYDSGTGWSKAQDPAQALQPFDDVYPGAHVIPFGPNARKTFYSMPMTQARAYEPYPSGGAYWSSIGSPSSMVRSDGNSVLLPLLPGASNAKVLIVGGGDPAVKTAEVMDVASGSPQWSSAAAMFFERRNANAVLLPDDRVLLVGGNYSGNSDKPVYTAEAYDPATDVWTMLPAMNRARVYHSVAQLLPDGRVWVAGSFAQITERNIEVYSPGYLFEGARPVITSAPSVINYGTPFTITTSLPISAIRLIRLGVTTHAREMDQRSVGLAFNPTNGSWQVSAPANANVAPPGLYMLFVLRPKAASLSGQSAIPSVARIVNVRKPTP